MKITLISLFLILVVLIFFAPIFIVLYKGGSVQPIGLGDWGSYLSGICGGLAFLVLAYTTYLTWSQFKRQNEDSVFYKLFDSLQYRIQHSSIMVGESEFFAHKSLKHIVMRIRKELSMEAVEVGRELLWQDPENLGVTQYSKLFQAIKGSRWMETFEADRKGFIEEIMAQENGSARWEVLKYYIGSRGHESDCVREALRTIGSVKFYKIPFGDRQEHYSAALNRVLEDHGEFLDGYLNTVLYIAEVAAASTNWQQYSRYIKSQITCYEAVIIFYMLVNRREKTVGVDSLKKIGILDRLMASDCRGLMIDVPDEVEIKREVAEIFATEYCV